MPCGLWAIIKQAFVFVFHLYAWKLILIESMPRKMAYLEKSHLQMLNKQLIISKNKAEECFAELSDRALFFLAHPVRNFSFPTSYLPAPLNWIMKCLFLCHKQFHIPGLDQITPPWLSVGPLIRCIWVEYKSVFSLLSVIIKLIIVDWG